MSSAAYVILKNHEVFGTLTKNHVETLAYGATLSRFDKGASLYEIDEPMEYVFVITKGIVKLVSDEFDGKFVIKDIIYKDRFFGENIFSKNPLRTENAIAVKECSVLKIKVEAFKQVVTEDIDFARFILSTMSENSAKIQERMSLYVHADSRARIIHFFKDFVDQLGVPTPNGKELDHGLSHNEIGFLTDTSRQTVSKVMGELKTKGIIHFEERQPAKLWVKGEIE